METRLENPYRDPYTKPPGSPPTRGRGISATSGMPSVEAQFHSVLRTRRVESRVSLVRITIMVSVSISSFYRYLGPCGSSDLCDMSLILFWPSGFGFKVVDFG